tara:strand:- start:1037 stop:1273 length:237 start_codon:yes stop_codon:yes gene_type:complete
MRDITTMIESMSAEQIRAVMASIKQNNRRTVDTRHRLRKNAKTALYFDVAPLPYKSSFEEYKLESEAIRQQVISGVDL